MKRLLALIFALPNLLGAFCAQPVDGISVRDLKIARNGELLVVEMALDLSLLEVESDRAVLFTPRIVAEADTLDLPSVGIYGRRRYYHYLRQSPHMLSGRGEKSFRSTERPDSLPYRDIVSWAAWMDGAQLQLDRRDFGCCNTLLDEQSGLLGGYREPAEPFIPQPLYVRPAAEMEKSRSLSGSAFIDFPVNKTTIYPEYRRNTVELGKIQATIDSVRNDADITITSVWLKGYASPESPYSHNRDLAIGRTAALRNHIQQLYHFAEGVISTDYEPEDWEGLRRYVERSNLENREAILALIDSDMDPDAKEAKIRRTYPEQYRFLLQNCYPALRHTDYRISYTIRTFNDVEEIRRIMRTQPGKLSLNELYLLAQASEPGTEEFDEIFETAVRLYPDDCTANLNAANTALRRGDLAGALRYLAKAGDTPQADYARGVHACLSQQPEAARTYFLRAAEAGIDPAKEALERMAGDR